MCKSLFLRTPMVLAELLFVNMAAWGHSKTDLITVSTGDMLTGAINNMAAGKLSLSTGYAGTISIKWREIEQIKSRYLYEVRLYEGERLYGRFVAGDTADQLTFRPRKRVVIGPKGLFSKVISLAIQASWSLR